MHLIFDTETTGLPLKGQYQNPKHPMTPRVIELAALLMDDNGVIVDYINTLIIPEGFEVPRQATAVHGISHEKAVAEGRPYEKVIQNFRDLSISAKTIVAHNLDYDLLCVAGDFFRFYGKLPNFDRLEKYCTKLATTDQVCIPNKWGGFKWPTLEEAYIHYFNQPVLGAHRAMTDVRHTARLYFKVRYDRDISLPVEPPAE